MIFALLLVAATPSPAPRDVVTRMFAAFNDHDAAAIAKLYAPDAVLTSPDFCGPRGSPDIERTYAALFAAYPDIRDVVEETVADGDRVAVRFTATAKSADFRLPIATFLRVRNGRIVEDRSYFDNGGRPCEK